MAEKEDSKDIKDNNATTDEFENDIVSETEDVAKDDNQDETAENAGDDIEQTAENESAGKSKLFSKKDRKDRKDKKDVKIEELNDRLVRLMAEYDNYRKRTDKEKTLMYEMGAKSIVEKVLPVIDNFERGFDCVDEKAKEDPFVQGMDKIYKQMIIMLEEAGVKAIDAVGKEFDPNIHNAVMHIDDESMEANVVAEEFQKGYMYRDSVIRCSMVKVAN